MLTESHYPLDFKQCCTQYLNLNPCNLCAELQSELNHLQNASHDYHNPAALFAYERKWAGKCLFTGVSSNSFSAIIDLSLTSCTCVIAFFVNGKIMSIGIWNRLSLRLSLTNSHQSIIDYCIQPKPNLETDVSKLPGARFPTPSYPPWYPLYVLPSTTPIWL